MDPAVLVCFVVSWRQCQIKWSPKNKSHWTGTFAQITSATQLASPQVLISTSLQPKTCVLCSFTEISLVIYLHKPFYKLLTGSQNAASRLFDVCLSHQVHQSLLRTPCLLPCWEKLLVPSARKEGKKSNGFDGWIDVCGLNFIHRVCLYWELLALLPPTSWQNTPPPSIFMKYTPDQEPAHEYLISLWALLTLLHFLLWWQFLSIQE